MGSILRFDPVPTPTTGGREWSRPQVPVPRKGVRIPPQRHEIVTGQGEEETRLFGYHMEVELLPTRFPPGELLLEVLPVEPEEEPEGTHEQLHPLLPDTPVPPVPTRVRTPVRTSPVRSSLESQEGCGGDG